MKSSIKDIAREANVSVSTVSRVLNNSKFVSEDLKRRVMRAVNETGYKPNLVAKGLVNKKTNLVGVLIPRISNDFFSMLIEGIEEVAQNYGYNILLGTSYNDIKKELEYLNIFEDRQLDGIIFSVTEFTEEHQEFFERTTLPSVFIGQKLDEQSRFPCVTVDNVKASFEATMYLINKNHIDIAVLGGPETDRATGVHRVEGYRQALKERGLKVRSEWQTNRYHTIENGYYAAAKVMANPRKPTAIFACSDQQALGAINYLTEQGYKVPEDISVIGFDDINLATVLRPKLTTVKQDSVDIGATAVRLLIDQIRGEPVKMLENLVPYRLVVRDSTKFLDS